MDALGIRLPVSVPSVPAVQAAPVPTKVETTPVLPLGNDTVFDPSTAEQKRYQAVAQASQDVANYFALSDKSFTIFKDSSGQYITRYTSLRDGKVTYFPEPEVLKRGNSQGAILNIPA